MKATIQRVLNAQVVVGDSVISEITQGLLVFLGISKTDTKTDTDYMIRKILNTRLFDNSEGKAWASSVTQKDYEILIVSQFTLYAILKGNKPDFHNAMPPKVWCWSANIAKLQNKKEASEFYSNFLEELKSKYNADKIKEGQFGAYMEVKLTNDGPITLNLESPQK